MKSVTVYSTKICPYCVKAKALLKRKGIDYIEIDLTGNESGRLELVGKSGGRKTVPQIFIGDLHVGGCDDLYALESKGALDQLLHA